MALETPPPWNQRKLRRINPGFDPLEPWILGYYYGGPLSFICGVFWRTVARFQFHSPLRRSRFSSGLRTTNIDSRLRLYRLALHRSPLTGSPSGFQSAGYGVEVARKHSHIVDDLQRQDTFLEYVPNGPPIIDELLSLIVHLSEPTLLASCRRQDEDDNIIGARTHRRINTSRRMHSSNPRRI